KSGPATGNRYHVTGDITALVGGK
mgnify:CR=1